MVASFDVDLAVAVVACALAETVEKDAVQFEEVCFFELGVDQVFYVCDGDWMVFCFEVFA